MPDPKMASEKNHPKQSSKNRPFWSTWASKAPNVDLIIRTIITRSSEKKRPEFLQKSREAKIPDFKKHFVRIYIWLLLYLLCEGFPFIPLRSKTNTEDKQQAVLEPRKGTGPPRTQNLILS